MVIKLIKNKFALPAPLAVHLHLEKKGINKSGKNSKRAAKDHAELLEQDRLLLDPDLTLIDVCYIADYKFEAPLRLSFKFVRYDPSLNGRTQCESPATLLQQKKQFSVPWNGVSTTSNGHSCINGTVDYAKYKVSRTLYYI